MIQDHAKYASKVEDWKQWSDEQLQEFLTAFRNRRTIQTFGSFFKHEKELQKIDEQEEPVHLCPHCKEPNCQIPIRAGPKYYADDWKVIGNQFTQFPEERLDPEYYYTAVQTETVSYAIEDF